MCGIAGVWMFAGARESVLHTCIRSMTDTLSHRGPDGDGHWVDEAAGLALGHRRLAIIDLSETGVQPMTSSNGRFVITYNGEIYNAAELAAELAVPLRGSSDTEILLEAVSRFGIDGALRRANGMFAFAVFDRETRILHLARDRIGIKPLYWTRQGGTFAFASELRALRVVPALDFTLDHEVVAAYLRHACVPAPLSIFRHMAKLQPGRRLEISAEGAREITYWDLPALAVEGQAHADRRPAAEIADELDGLLRDAVQRQMVSDVPLGAFLSGGIDSSTVVALMQRASARPVRTFSIGFAEEGYNEADHARAVARHLGTDHTELTLSADDALSLIPRLPEIYDEPFADSSQLPTYLVSRLARSAVTVALSGDGGDENFAGYVRYQGIERIWRAVRHVPPVLRRAAARGVVAIPPAAWDMAGRPIPARLRPAHFGDKIVKAAGLFRADSPADMYRRLITQWPEPQVLIPPVQASGELQAASVAGLDTVSRLRLMDMTGYLPDDILTKVDRASMAVGLEVRVPLLDHRVIEFAWRLPTEALIGGGRGKLPLRAVLDRYVPRELIDRPKMGFGVPIGGWLRGPLREWTGDLLSPAALSRQGLFDPAIVARYLDEHLSGRRNWQYALWTLLQFQAWQRAQPVASPD